MHYMRRTRAAHRHVFATSRAALQFAVQFSQMDLTHTDATALCAVERKLDGLINRDAPEPAAVEAFSPLLIRELQARLIQILMPLATQPQPPAAVRLTLARLPEVGIVAVRDGHTVRVHVMGSPVDRLTYQLIRVLEAVGVERLRVCAAPDCGRLFWKVTRKEFCSTRCQSRHYMRGYRATDAAPSKEAHGKTQRRAGRK